MELQTAKELALKLMAKHDLNDWRFDFNNRKGAYGVCSHSKRTIFLSAPLTRAVKDDAAIENTILHEIAHALVGSGHGHDYVWRSKALEIGCDGERCHSHEKDIENVRYKYLATCPICGEKMGASRQKKRSSWHSQCGAHLGFKPENKLNFIQQY